MFPSRDVEHGDVRIGQVVVPDHGENQPVRLRQHVGPDVVRFASRGIDGGDLFKGAARHGDAHDPDRTARCQSIVVDEVVGAPRTAVESDEGVDEDDGRAAAERRHDQVHAIVRAREPEPASVGGKEQALGAFGAEQLRPAKLITLPVPQPTVPRFARAGVQQTLAVRRQRHPLPNQTSDEFFPRWERQAVQNERTRRLRPEERPSETGEKPGSYRPP